MFQINIQRQFGSKYSTFNLPIVNEKETGEIEYNHKAPLVEYRQNASKSCCRSSLSSSFTVAGENNYVRAGAMQI